MKYLYLFATIIAILSLVVISNPKATANIFAGPSILDGNKSEIEMSDVDIIQLPKAVGSEELEIGAQSYLVLDRETLTPLLTKNINDKKLIASVTKLMVAVVTVENSNINDIIEIKKDYSYAPPGRMGLRYAEKISIENILKGLLVSSANDAAEALANQIGGLGYQGFIQKMNEKAAEIGMTNTHFSNAIGLDYKDNYSSVWDLGLLANYALNKEFIAETAKISELTVNSADGLITHNLKSTNILLEDKDIEVYGLKTGSTPLAGGCLVTFAKIKNSHEILTVVLGSADRFGDTKKMIQWIEKNIEWK